MRAFFENEDGVVEVVYEFVTSLNVKVTKETVKLTLIKHPEYPSLNSVTDVLKEWGIDNASIQVDTKRLNELPTPFIGVLKTDDTYFTAVKRIKDGKVIRYDSEKGHIKEGIDDFLKKWNGISVIAEADEKSGENNYKKNKKQEEASQIGGYLALLVIGLLGMISILNLLTMFSFIWIGLVVIKGLGTAISYNLLRLESDSGSKLMNKICRIGKNMDCNEIIKSAGSTLFGLISWAEIGFMYFAGWLLALLFIPTSVTLMTTLVISNALGVIFIFYSLYYQAFVAKKWCVLCLSVIVLLIIEFFLLLPEWRDGIQQIDARQLLTIATAFAVPITGWFFVKRISMRLKELKVLEYQYYKLKYNKVLFTNIQKQQQAMPRKISDLAAITIGDQNASNIITFVTNPYCGPCAVAHSELEEFLKLNRQYKAELVFTLDGDLNGSKNDIIKHWLAIARQKNISTEITSWFQQPIKDYEAWAVNYPVEIPEQLNEEIQEMLDYQKSWFNEANIVSTPTIFFNENRLSPLFKLEDLRHVLK